MNYYPHHIGDYTKDTAHLSMIEDGAYRRLLDLYYSTERPLPKERAALYRLLRARTKDEQKAIDTVLLEFFADDVDGWRHNRCDAEIAKAHDKSHKARTSAEISAAVRRGEATSKKSIVRAQWKALVDACGGVCVRCGASAPLERDHIIPTYQGGEDRYENWQPLCRTCNASKGNEAVDHRPLNWRSAFAQRSLSVGLAPNSQSQEPIAKATDSSLRLESSAEAARDESPVVETLPTNNGREYQVRQSFVAQLEPLYPAVDVPATIREMKGWLLGNPHRRKTPRGTPAFITGWLKREQEKANGAAPG